MGKAGSPFCMYVDYKYYNYMVGFGRASEIHDTKIVFIALSMWTLLTRSVRPTQREQTISITSWHAPSQSAAL